MVVSQKKKLVSKMNIQLFGHFYGQLAGHPHQPMDLQFPN